MLFEVESHHDGLTDTFYFIRCGLNDPLDEMKAFGSNFRNGGLYGNMIGCENLLYKIGFDMNDHYADLFPVHSRTYGGEIFSLPQVIERKVDSVVDVTEFIYVVEAQLDRQSVVKYDFFHCFHLIFLNLAQKYYFCVLFSTEIVQEMIEDIKKACQVMNEGGVILYPTDTIWGIGCDATNEEAVRRVYEIKKRADSKAMLVLVDSPVKVDFYVQDVPAVAWDLIEVADKPLTIIYSGARNLARNLLAEDGSVGIRVTNEEFSQRLGQQFRKAIVSTSANVSGQPGAANFSEISDEIKSAVDYIVGFRQEDLSRPKPSSIIKLDKGGVIKIIRE